MAGALCVAFAGCDEIAAPSSDRDALRGARMAGGEVTLVPPAGYCIDRRSLRANFALMARCDTLGGTETFGAPLAVITATTVPAVPLPTGSATESEAILAQRQTTTYSLRQVKGKPPSSDMREVFWRGKATVGTHVLGLAIYEAASEPELGELAPDLLAQTIRRTQAQTASKAVSRQDNSATTETKQGQSG